MSAIPMTISVDEVRDIILEFNVRLCQLEDEVRCLKLELATHNQKNVAYNPTERSKNIRYSVEELKSLRPQGIALAIPGKMPPIQTYHTVPYTHGLSPSASPSASAPSSSITTPNSSQQRNRANLKVNIENDYVPSIGSKSPASSSRFVKRGGHRRVEITSDTNNSNTPKSSTSSDDLVTNIAQGNQGGATKPTMAKYDADWIRERWDECF